MTIDERTNADKAVFRAHAELDEFRTYWGPPNLCGFSRSDMTSLTGLLSSEDLGLHGTPDALSPEQEERMLPTVRRLGFSSVQDLWKWENAPGRTAENVDDLLRTVLTSSPQGALREARRLLTQYDWKPLGTAFRKATTSDDDRHAMRCTLETLDPQGQTVHVDAVECEHTHPQAICYSIIPAVYAAFHPKGRQQTSKYAEEIDSILQVLCDALPHAVDAPTGTLYANTRATDGACTAVEAYEQAPGRTHDEIAALFDRAIEMEDQRVRDHQARQGSSD